MTGRVILFSQTSVLVVVAGVALGYSNLLEFPLMVGRSGGSAFILVFLLCQLLIAVPVLLSEMLLGRRSRSDSVSGWKVLSADRIFSTEWRFLGWAMWLAGFFSIAAYSVLFGWSFNYIEGFWQGDLTQNTDFFRYFSSVVHDPMSSSVYQLIFFAILGLGCLSGTKRAVIPLMLGLVPVTVVLIFWLLIDVSSTATWESAVSQVFGWRWHELTEDALIRIPELSFFSLGIGVGAVWLIASFTSSEVSIGKVLLWVMVVDLLVSLVMALFMWQLSFSVSDPRWLGAEIVFQQLPAQLDSIQIMMFLGIMLLVGVTSALMVFASLVEVISVRYKLDRLQATAIVMVGVGFFGMAGQFSFNVMSPLLWYGQSLYEAYVTLSVGFLVPLSGSLLALFVGWIMRTKDAQDEWQPTLVWRFWVWRWSLRLVSMVAVILVFFASMKLHLGINAWQATAFLLFLLMLIIGSQLQLRWKNNP